MVALSAFTRCPVECWLQHPRLLLCEPSPEIALFQFGYLVTGPKLRGVLLLLHRAQERREDGESHLRSSSDWAASPPHPSSSSLRRGGEKSSGYFYTQQPHLREFLHSVPPRIYRRGAEVFSSGSHPAQKRGEEWWFQGRNDICRSAGSFCLISSLTLWIEEKYPTTVQIFFSYFLGKYFK